MKRLLAILVTAVMCLTLASAMAGGAEPAYRAPDTKTWQGTWQSAYSQILSEHIGGIFAFQGRTVEFYSNGKSYNVPCKPIGLYELTGDSVPELFFIESAIDSEGYEQGNLYIYTSDGSTAKCMLVIPAIIQVGYDDMNGFTISRAADGSLVAEYWWFELPLAVQYTRTALNQYIMVSYWSAEYDNSGESDDTFYRNGYAVSEADYNSGLAALRGGSTLVADYNGYGYDHFGLQMTWDETAQALNSGSVSSPGTDSGINTGVNTSSGEIWGYTIDKLATRKGPGTQYEGGGTYSVKNQWIKVLAKAWDKRNGIWWVKCEIPYHGKIRVLWTGYKRFDPTTLDIDLIPEDTSW